MGLARVLLGKDLEQFVECGGRIGNLRSVRQPGWRNGADEGEVTGTQNSLFLCLLWVVERVGVIPEVFGELHFLDRLPDINFHCLTLSWLDNSSIQLLLAGVWRGLVG